MRKNMVHGEGERGGERKEDRRVYVLTVHVRWENS